jgi:hypothetical protein
MAGVMISWEGRVETKATGCIVAYVAQPLKVNLSATSPKYTPALGHR